MNKNYKDTLLMPKTNFEMRANLNVKEPLIEKFWHEKEIYQKLLKRNQKNKRFILHDGPPYANGDLHLGHALNKILKDFIIRYYTMNNFYAPFIPGWDTHGLPIEQAVTNNGFDRKKIAVDEFRSACKKYAEEQVNKQKEQFQRLGLLTDFKKYYATYDKEYETEQIRLFAKMVNDGLIYRNLYPVYWSPSSESALAEAEIIYLEKRSPAIYVAFKIISNQTEWNNTNVLIWTTTPWTIPANQLLAVNKNFKYSIIQINNQKFLIAQDLLQQFLIATKTDTYEIINNNLSGKDLLNLITEHPLYKRATKIVHSDHVTNESGTGIVHIAPGFGVDDFLLGKKEQITPLVIIDDQGKFTSEVNDVMLVNRFYDDTNKDIVEKLKTNGNLFAFSWFKHSYPHDWRTKKPVIFRATWQWFVAISKIKTSLLKNIDKVNFLPDWGQKRMQLMIENRNDWCISRQRAWGVPIPIFYSEKKEAILDPFLINYVADLFAVKGSNIWYSSKTIDLLPPNYQHPDSPNGIFYREQDIMDVWYDSSISHQVVAKNNSLMLPFNLYLEGNDQFRGWFNSSLITGTINTNESPYLSVVSHGFVNDEKGQKMSKSVGNVINLQEITDKYGADILRLWVASVDFKDDTRIGSEILKQISENYRKIRNLIRFLLGNLSDFNFENKLNTNYFDEFINLAEVDQFILIKLNNLTNEINNYYRSYQFNNIYFSLLNFISNDLSAFYCDYSKDILYVNAESDHRRKAIQTTFYYLVTTLLQLLAPLIPHTCEEAFQFLLNNEFKGTSNKSIMFSTFPQAITIKNANNILNKWNLFMELRNDVNQALTEAQSKKIIKIPLEAKVTIKLHDDYQILQNIDQEELTKLLIVSEAQWTKNNELNVFNGKIATITIEQKIGTKCERCWLIVTNSINDICQRCNLVLNERKFENEKIQNQEFYK